ncbi:MAG: orotidine-5'-phosphate decarboxylase [Clostridiales bacterium]|jgi:orotidine-5'-phosphate decarboxylase|nr:orotidine-5'-phosphate decarboxylase [Clostridiales bacterium]
MIIDKLIDEIKKKSNPTALGLDTCADYLPGELRVKIKDFKDAGRVIFEFNKSIIDAAADLIPAVKLQAAYYEMYGAHGMEAYEKTREYAKSRGLITIADVKRNDIASTAGAYSRAYLSCSDIGIPAYDFDFMTVNPYLGSDGIEPFLADCKSREKGLFILVKTSNKSSSELQNQILKDGRTVYELVGGFVENWGRDLVGKYGYSSVGAVVGATQKEEARKIRKAYANMFFLIPGYGAQGGSAADLSVSFDERGLGAVVNNSRGIICAHKKFPELKYYEAARKAVVLMKEDLGKERFDSENIF